MTTHPDTLRQDGPGSACDEKGVRGIPYLEYARIDALHGLAEPRTGSSRELSFLLINHVQEILLRLFHVDVCEARLRLCADNVCAAILCLDRATRTARLLVASWDTMATITPDDFLQFRDALGEASASQSYMYRVVEFSLGRKEAQTVRRWTPYLGAYPILADELTTASIYDEALRYVDRHGISVPSCVLERDVTAPYESNADVEGIWAAVYREPQKQPDLRRLGESLIEVAYQFSLWGAHHALIVERVLGNKPGTGGTSGLEWLRKANEYRYFPELWSARDRL